MTTTRERREFRSLVAAAGLLLICAGTWVAYRNFQQWGEDFAPQYVAAQLLVHGGNMYDFQQAHAAYLRYVGHDTTWAYFYTPCSGMAVLPFIVLPYPAARMAWFWLGVAAVLFGLWRLMRLLAPKWDSSTCLLLLGLVMCSSSVRWAFKVGQHAPLVLGLLGLFFVALARDRRGFAFGCALFVCCLKPTFAIPFLGLMLVRRNFGLAAAVVGVWIALNGVGMMRMGGPAIIADYRQNMAQFERPDQLNYPDPRGFNSLDRLDWPYLFNAISPDFPRSNRLGALLTLLSAGWIAWEARRARACCRETATLGAFLGPLCCLSLLGVYHHHYDILILIAPLLVYLAGAANAQEGDFAAAGMGAVRGVRWFVGAWVVYGGLWAAYQVRALAERLIGPNAGFAVKALGCVAVSIMFAASLVVLHAYLERRLRAPAAAPEPVGKAVAAME